MAPIQLDTTLADLYREHGINGRHIMTVHCVFGHMDLHQEFPRELTFPEDEEPIPYSNSEEEKTRLRSIILGFKPLRRAFGLGNMEVIFFGPHVNESRIERELSQLAPNQRHRPRLIQLDKGNVSTQLHELTKDKTLVFWRPQGWMLEHDCMIDPHLAYKINSKDYLVKSGIRTPPSELVSLDDIGTTSLFATRPLPFAVKLFRASCGFGTFLVTSEPRRQELLVSLATYKKRGTTSVIVSKYIDWVKDLCINFFIGPPEDERNRHNPRIVAVLGETFTENGKWVGDYIDYRAQPELKEMVRETVKDTARRLPAEFVGWAGIDVVIDSNGDQWVVDLNARLTASLSICLMSGHFWKQRGFPMAQFATFEYAGELDKVYCTLTPYLETGRVVITATAVIGPLLNMADITWGGMDEEDLARFVGIIRQRLAGL